MDAQPPDKKDPCNTMDDLQVVATLEGMSRDIPPVSYEKTFAREPGAMATVITTLSVPPLPPDARPATELSDIHRLC
jgi:hypothetical protein